MKYSFFILLSTVLCISCKKDDNKVNTGDSGNIILEFDNVFAADDLALNTATYTNSNNEQFNISALKYFISNIKLKTSAGAEYVVPVNDSYFLVNEADESSHEIELENVPAGDYTSFTFTVGVDADKSTAPLAERTGALDPAGAAADMYWNSNDGYIFLKLEGASPASAEAENAISYNIGGYGGASGVNNLKTVTITAPSGMMAKVRKPTDHTPEVHIFADAAKILDGPNPVSIAANPTFGLSAGSSVVANNYANMFNIDHIHND